MPKYFDTKKGSLESAVLEAVSPAQQAAIAISKKEKGEKPKNEKDENNYIHAAKMAKEKGEKTFTIGGKQYDVEEVLKTETNKNDKSDDGEGLDAVQPKAVKKKFADRKDKDIDNDGDIDNSDKFLHKRRKAISKSMKSEEMDPTDHVKEKDGKFCVYNADGSIAKEFDNKDDADKYAIDNHDKLMATKKEVKEETVVDAIRAMWEASAKKADAKTEEDDDEDKKKKTIKGGDTTMTGKPMSKVEVAPKEKD